MPPHRPLHERFWALVTKGRIDECWEWQGWRDPKGYGHYPYREGGKSKGGTAHRVAYQIEVDPIPEGLTIDHLCRNRGCVNPAHLEAVEHRTNVRRGNAGAAQRNKTHCPRGHPYAGDNLIVKHSRGRIERHCRECMRAAWRKYSRRRREESRATG